MLFEMLAGYPPFYTEKNNPIKLYEKILSCDVNYPSFFEAGAKDLLSSLLTADLSKRFGNLHRGSRDIFSHMWFAEIDWDSLYRKEIPAPYVPSISLDGDASRCVACAARHSDTGSTTIPKTIPASTVVTRTPTNTRGCFRTFSRYNSIVYVSVIYASHC